MGCKASRACNQDENCPSKWFFTYWWTHISTYSWRPSLSMVVFTLTFLSVCSHLITRDKKMLNQHFNLLKNTNFFQGNNVPFKNINQRHIVMWPNEHNIFDARTFSFPHLEKYEAFDLSYQNFIKKKWFSCSTTWSIGIESCNNTPTILPSNSKMTFTTPMCFQVH